MYKKTILLVPAFLCLRDSIRHIKSNKKSLIKKLLCFLGGAILICTGHAQNRMPLTVGDSLPQISLSNMVNGNTGSRNLYTAGKAVLIDFFETHCGGCIELLPFLDSLYKKKKDSLSVFVVTDEPSDVIQRFLKTNPNAKNISLPFVTDDTLLNKLFKHHSIPHEVWIGKDRVVKAVTASGYVTESNIEKLCAGKPLHLPVKNDYVVYDPAEPLSDYAGADRLISASTLTGYIDNLPKFYHSSVRLADSTHKKIFFINCSLLPFISMIYDNKYSANRFILSVRDSSKLLHLNKAEGDKWFIDNSYCYELTMPDSASPRAIREGIIKNLSTAFNLKIRLIKKQESCYLVIKTGRAKINPQTKGGKEAVNFYPQNGEPAELQNAPLSDLIAAMNASNFGNNAPIVIDSTGQKINVDMKLPVSSIKDIAALDKALRPYGFGIIKTIKPIDMINISDI